jgi:hypothetical protein
MPAAMPSRSTGSNGPMSRRWRHEHELDNRGHLRVTLPNPHDPGQLCRCHGERAGAGVPAAVSPGLRGVPERLPAPTDHDRRHLPLRCPSVRRGVPTVRPALSDQVVLARSILHRIHPGGPRKLSQMVRADLRRRHATDHLDRLSRARLWRWRIGLDRGEAGDGAVP